MIRERAAVIPLLPRRRAIMPLPPLPGYRVTPTAAADASFAARYRPRSQPPLAAAVLIYAHFMFHA
jgi:hypothetical protein